MKITIQTLERKPVTTKKGPATKVGVKSNGVWYSCFENATTKTWNEGDEIDVQVEKNGQYNNIVFPRQAQAYQPSNNQLNEAVKLTLERIEKKLDRLLGNVTYTLPNANTTLPKDIPQIPFEGDPHPTDEDAPF